MKAEKFERETPDNIKKAINRSPEPTESQKAEEKAP
jgi:hypothetical protein